MDILTETQKFEIDYDFFEYLGEGKTGHVYRLSKNLAGKFLKHPNPPSVENEAKMCTLAYERGISVPKPEGIFEIKHPAKNNLMSVFVMEYIPGITLHEISEKDFKFYRRLSLLVAKEIRKAYERGICITDNYPKNSLWHEKRKRLYLVDFTDWIIFDIE